MNDLLPVSHSPWKRAGRVLAAGLLGGALLTAAGLGAHQVLHDDGFRIYEVEIHGARRASLPQLRHLADVPVGAHLAAADLDAVRRGVERHPWVAQATVSRAYPSAIEIHVVEHEPVMLLALDRLWYVDARGRPIKQAHSDDLDFPVLTGLSADLADRRPELAAAVVQGALRAWRACDGQPVAPDGVSEIHHDPQTGYTLVLRSGTRLLLGDDDPTGAFDRLARLVAHGLDLSRPQHVDLAVETLAVATPLPALDAPPLAPVLPDPAQAVQGAPALAPAHP